jgi:hypothetical protein
MASVYVKRWTSRGPTGRRTRHVAFGLPDTLDPRGPKGPGR